MPTPNPVLYIGFGLGLVLSPLFTDAVVFGVAIVFITVVLSYIFPKEWKE